jgi:Tetracyclin repressor-like, C-terminal domain
LLALPKALVNVNMFIRTYLLRPYVNRALSLSRRHSFGTKSFSPSRRGAIAADIEQGKEDGELHPEADPELLIDTIFGALFYRLLFRSAPLNERFVEELVCQVFRGVRVQAEPLTPASNARPVQNRN